MAVKTKNTDKAISSWLAGLGRDDGEIVLEYIRDQARTAFTKGKSQRPLATITGIMKGLKFSYNRAKRAVDKLMSDGKIRHLHGGRAHRLIPTEV